jgi:hypothetical protein
LVRFSAEKKEAIPVSPKTVKLKLGGLWIAFERF